MQAAIAKAFKTPEVIRMFAKREPSALRARLASLQQDHKLGRVSDDAFQDQAEEVIVALKKLGEELTMEEKAILEASDDAMQLFKAADAAIDESVLTVAGEGIKQAKK